MNLLRQAVVVLIATSLLQIQTFAGTGDTSWMSEGKYGIFLHYQYRILLGYSIKTKPQFPNPSQMTAEGWNRFVDGFDVKGFAQQMAEAKVGWVLFCLDDHYFAWPCAPNQAFSDYTGYAPGREVFPPGSDPGFGGRTECQGREADLLLCRLERLHEGAEGFRGIGRERVAGAVE